MKDKVITQLGEIFERVNYSEEEKQRLREVIKRHPMRIPEYYYDLIDFSKTDDPIRMLAIPSVLEADLLGEEDTSGEASNTKMPGLQHKYKQTALVLCTNNCFMYCRHCFRKRMVGYTSEEILERKNEAVDYIRNHLEINNVLITGGDAFTMSNDLVEGYLKDLCELEHLDFIRFGTRSIVVKPDRIYDDLELLKILNKYTKKKEIIIVTHFNHAKEITEEARKAIRALKNQGLVIRNQAVLLKGVNDNEEKLANLFNGLANAGIQPYYLFQCRPVKGGVHFQVPLSRGIDLVDKTRERLNGISKAFRYIMSHKRGKIEIFGKTEDKIIFKFHQNKFLEDANKIFIKTVDEDALWLDMNLEYMK